MTTETAEPFEPIERRAPTATEAERYRWTFDDGHAEDGYRVFKGRQFLWLRPREAYEICTALADLLDEDNDQEHR